MTDNYAASAYAQLIGGDAPMMDRFMNILDEFDLSTNQRAEVFHAFDIAPQTAVGIDMAAYKMNAQAAWWRVRSFKLMKGESDTIHWWVKGHGEVVTRTDIMDGLEQAAKHIRKKRGGN